MGIAFTNFLYKRNMLILFYESLIDNLSKTGFFKKILFFFNSFSRFFSKINETFDVSTKPKSSILKHFFNCFDY